ncbi:unnamed protein product [Arabis nemorensis]|uniref:Glutaminyl-tRNA synthetase n=1 Tax=Arabis nemorensis TaxID=586526 RepID=A0A565B069_9BRAS|nr:unnamed protein product [Arabis nemorensis]
MVLGDDNTKKSLKLFLKIGLEEQTALDTVDRNSRVTSDLTALIHQAGVTNGCDRTTGNLLYTVATKYYGKALVHRPTWLKYIVSSKIKSLVQLDAAYLYLGNTSADDFKLNEFEEAFGVGVDVSPEDIERTVEEIFEENMNTVLRMLYRTNVGEFIGHVRKRFAWANPKTVKRVIDEKMYELLGERTAADNDKPTKKEKPARVENAVVEVVPHPSQEELNTYSVHTEVFFSDGSMLRCSNTKEVLDKHLKMTGGKVYTRLPPEPNGYLHIGHAKAMFVDFGLAKERGGYCYLRTQPSSMLTGSLT